MPHLPVSTSAIDRMFDLSYRKMSAGSKIKYLVLQDLHSPLEFRQGDLPLSEVIDIGFQNVQRQGIGRRRGRCPRAGKSASPVENRSGSPIGAARLRLLWFRSGQISTASDCRPSGSIPPTTSAISTTV